MSHSFKKNVQTTRRILLQTATGAEGNQQCDGCRQFIPPNACKQVEGVISPSGWCKMWAKKAG